MQFTARNAIAEEIREIVDIVLGNETPPGCDNQATCTWDEEFDSAGNPYDPYDAHEIIVTFRTAHGLQHHGMWLFYEQFVQLQAHSLRNLDNKLLAADFFAKKFDMYIPAQPPEEQYTSSSYWSAISELPRLCPVARVINERLSRVRIESQSICRRHFDNWVAKGVY